ncbi:MAG: DNA primase [Candidatus Pacebacteria bacterium]|jgi:DNA primase|nr:DNA primase [Candidatus Paceibacterota bacterium]
MSDAVEQIKERLSILDVISPYVELHRAGKNYKGKSPFSAEKTPSFYVSPDRGMYYCFSTSQGGDMFTFVQAMEGVDFKEALKILAQKAGVELVPEDPQKRSERDRLYAALEAATAFYEEQLPLESEAVAYLERRGVNKDTIAKWRIGFAPGPPKSGWREVKDHLVAKGYTKDELFKAGLIKSAEGGKEPFDVFRDRVMFPMFDPSGKVVAFSGRILHPDDRAPKYVNTPETLLYKKSELLFGYDKAKNGIRHLNFSLIVEGQFDVVMCHQAGYNNTVAVSGTALTLHHVQLLERLSNRVVLALDADRAGIAAMRKAANVMLRRGLDVKVAELPLGEDPADVVSKDPAILKKTIGNAVHVIEFLLHVLRREVADDRSFKLKVRDEVLPFILLLPNRIDQEHFVGLVTEAIKTTTDAVRFELDRLREQAESVVTETGARTVLGAKGEVARIATDIPQKAYVYLLAAVEVVSDELAKQVQSEMESILVLAELEEPDESERAGVLFTLEQLYVNMPALAIAEEVVAKLNQLKASLLRKRLNELRMIISELEADGDHEQLMQTLQGITELEKRLREPAYKAEDFISLDK